MFLKVTNDTEFYERDLHGDVERSERKRELQKQIDDLLAKIKKEKQFNRQVELKAEVKKLQKMLDSVWSSMRR